MDLTQDYVITVCFIRLATYETVFLGVYGLVKPVVRYQTFSLSVPLIELPGVF